VAWSEPTDTGTANNAASSTALTTNVSGEHCNANAGDIVIAAYGFDNLSATTPTCSPQKPPGEGANSWVKLGYVDSPQSSAGGGVRAELWGIVTTVDWIDHNMHVIFSGSISAKVFAFKVFPSGGSLTSRTSTLPKAGVNGTGSALRSQAESALVAGDLAIGIGVTESSTYINPDTDTDGGSWTNLQVRTASGGGAANVALAFQHKIVTADGTQQIDNTVSDGGVLCIGLRPAAGGPSAQTVTPTGIASAEAVGTPSVTGGAQPQVLPPTEDGTIAGAWETQNGFTTNLFASIDEAAPGSTAEYIQSPISPAAGEIYRCRFTTAAMPVDNTGHIIRFRHGKDATGGKAIEVTVSLYDASDVLVASRSYSTTDMDTTDRSDSFTLTEGEAATITDYSLLRLEFNPTASGGGGGRTYRIYWAELELPSASQNKILRPTGIASAQAFGSPSVDAPPPPQTVTPTGVASAEAFGAPVVDSPAPATNLAPVSIASAEAVGSPTIGLGAVTVVPVGIPTGEGVGAPTITPSVAVSPSGIASQEGFGAPSVVVIPPAQTVTPTGIATSEAFGSPTRTSVVTVSPTGIATGQAFGNPTRSSFITVAPVAVGSAESFGTPTLAPTIGVSPTGIPTGQAFGSPSVSGVVSVAPTGIGSAQAFGLPVIGGSVTVTANGIASAQNFGVPSISVGGVTLTPTGIGSAEGFGTPVIGLGAVTVVPTGIASAQAFGTPTRTSALTVAATGIASAQTFGVPSISVGGVTVTPTGIASAESLGAPALTMGAVNVTPTGIASAQAFGTPTRTSTVTVAATGITSAQAFGTAVITRNVTTTPSGITSAQAFGTPVSTTTVTVTPTGVPSAQALGVPSVLGVITVSPASITSAEAFGNPSIPSTEAQTITPVGMASLEVFGVPDLVQPFVGWGVPI
jgi:hypothetical protein